MAQTVSKSERAEKTRQRILDAAAQLFRENGYASVSLRSIAAGADMKAGSVYYHFRSKEEIVLEVLNVGIELVYSAVEKSYEDNRETETIEALISSAVFAHLETLLKHTDYTSANVRIYGQVPENIRSEALNARRKYEGLWDEILNTGSRRGAFRAGLDMRVFRLMLIGSLNATLEWFDPVQGSVEELARNYSQIFLNGLLGEK
ncbi:MAG: TetR/AcrR family transcriptional regulator [Sneathiella sp.]